MGRTLNFLISIFFEVQQLRDTFTVGYWPIAAQEHSELPRKNSHTLSRGSKRSLLAEPGLTDQHSQVFRYFTPAKSVFCIWGAGGEALGASSPPARMSVYFLSTNHNSVDLRQHISSYLV